MIVNLPTWTNIANSVEPWLSGTLNTFAPAAYLEIGIVAGVGIILFLILAVTGALDSLLGAFGRGSDPMRGISSGNSGMGYSGGSRPGRFGGFGRVGGVGGINTRVSTFHIRPGYTKMTDEQANEKYEQRYKERLAIRGKVKEDQKWSTADTGPASKIWHEPI